MSTGKWCSQSDSNRQLPDFESGDSTKLAYESVNYLLLLGGILLPKRDNAGGT
jgi:hypothetical protein